MPHSAEDMCQCLLSGIKCSDLQCRSAGDRTEDESHRYQKPKGNVGPMAEGAGQRVS